MLALASFHDSKHLTPVAAALLFATACGGLSGYGPDVVGGRPGEETGAETNNNNGGRLSSPL